MFSLGATTAWANTSTVGQIPNLPADSGNSILREGLSVGDVIAQGTANGDGTCDIDNYSLTTTASSDGETLWLAIYFDEDCQAVVSAMWAGALEDGPSDVVDPLFELLPYTTDDVPKEDQTNENFSSTIQDNGMGSLLASTKRSEHRVYMYGFGGTIDKLTKLWSIMRFTYDNSTAITVSMVETVMDRHCQLGNGWWIIANKRA